MRIMSSVLPGRRLSGCFSSARITLLLVACFTGIAPVSAAPKHHKPADRFSACLATTKGETDPRIDKCINAELGPNDPFNTCVSKAVSGWDLKQCIHGEMDRTWLRMERVYTDLLHRLPPRKARALEREQKDWASQREPKCANGQLQEDRLMCLVHQNTRRTEQLRRRLRGVHSGNTL
jgi:uncharacterized protein YecT (DUF1311 family)